MGKEPKIKIIKFQAQLKKGNKTIVRQSFRYQRGTMLRTAWRDSILYFLQKGKLEEHFCEELLDTGEEYSVVIKPTLIMDINKRTKEIEDEN